MKTSTILLGAALALGLATPARSESLQPLVGTVPPAAAAMEVVGPAPEDMPLEAVTVFLGLRDRRRLEGLIAAQQDPRTPAFHRWLDPPELADRFGARRAEYERVRGWFVERGFRVVRDSPHRLSVVVAGTAGQAGRTLVAPIRLLRRHGRLYHAPASDPLLPDGIAATVRGITGLDDLPKFRPLVQLGVGHAALAPVDFATAYQVTPLYAQGLTGAGRSIAVVARSNFSDEDVAMFAQHFVQPPRLLVAHKLVDVTSDPGVLPAKGEETEVLLDAEWAGALAPAAQVNVVISPRGGDIPDSLDKAVYDREGDVVTISFSFCEAEAPAIQSEMLDSLYALANAQGQTVLVASGDSGATECPANPNRLAVNALAASPHAVAVGGSSFGLAADGSASAAVDERVWSDEFGAGGGGESLRFARPLYQLAAGLALLSPRRVLPDLALAASPQTPGYVIWQRGVHVIGGTSAGAPALASVLALVNEHLGSGGLGQLLPGLYRLGSEQARGLRTAVFRDITQGSNALPESAGFPAGPGFDLATGWGAPLAAPLAEALMGPGRCEPEVECLVPAMGAPRHRCAAEWLVEGTFTPGPRLPGPHQSCRDGDPQCDADGVADGACTVNVALCLNVVDARPGMSAAPGVPRCEPGKVRRVHLLGPVPAPRDRTAAVNRSTLRTALLSLPYLPSTLRTACTATVPVVVPVDSATTRRTPLRARVVHDGGTTIARLLLRCTAP